MKIAFVGAGKVGAALGKYLSVENEVVGYASLSYESALDAASFTNSKAFRMHDGASLHPDMRTMVSQTDLLFLSVPDGQIAPVWRELVANSDVASALRGRIVAHCSGALASNLFEGAKELGVAACSIHPLFAVSSRNAAEELGESFFTVEGDPSRVDEAVELLTRLGNNVQVVPTEQKVRYHAAAVMASNQVVALYRMAADELVNCGFSQEGAERALAPLFLGNARHVAEDGPVASLTGPAERGDLATIERHLAVLKGDSHEAYEVLNRVLLNLAEEKRSRA